MLAGPLTVGGVSASDRSNNRGDAANLRNSVSTPCGRADPLSDSLSMDGTARRRDRIEKGSGS